MIQKLLWGSLVYQLMAFSFVEVVCIPLYHINISQSYTVQKNLECLDEREYTIMTEILWKQPTIRSFSNQVTESRWMKIEFEWFKTLESRRVTN